MVMAKGMVVVEYLPNMYKTLCLIPVMQKKQNNKNNNRKKQEWQTRNRWQSVPVSKLLLRTYS